MMSVLKIILILTLLVPAGFIMSRMASDVRRDILRHKKLARAAAPPDRSRFRVIK